MQLLCGVVRRTRPFWQGFGGVLARRAFGPEWVMPAERSQKRPVVFIELCMSEQVGTALKGPFEALLTAPSGNRTMVATA